MWSDCRSSSSTDVYTSRCAACGGHCPSSSHRQHGRLALPSPTSELAAARPMSVAPIGLSLSGLSDARKPTERVVGRLATPHWNASPPKAGGSGAVGGSGGGGVGGGYWTPVASRARSRSIGETTLDASSRGRHTSCVAGSRSNSDQKAQTRARSV